MDNCNIRICGQGILQNRNQRFINFHSHHFPGLFGKVLGHGADPWPDFQHTVILSDSCRLHNGFQNAGFYQEILAEFLLEVKIIFLQYLNRTGWRT